MKITTPRFFGSLLLLIAISAACSRASKNEPPNAQNDALSGNGGHGGATPTGSDATGGFVFVPVPPGSNTGGSAPVPLPNPLLDLCAASLGGAGGMGGGMNSVGNAEGSLVIDDFESGSESVFSNGMSGHWESHNDFTMGGLQSPLGGRHEPAHNWTDSIDGNATFVSGRNGGKAAHFTGTGFGVWGSGQALYFATDDQGGDCIYDASAFDGITFWAKGSVALTYPDDFAKQPQAVEVGKLKVHVVERDVVPNALGGGCDQETQDCWDSQRARVELKDCWQKFVIPFSEMKRDGWSKLDSGPLDLNELYQLVFEVSEHQTYDIALDDIQFYVGQAPTSVACETK